MRRVVLAVSGTVFLALLALSLGAARVDAQNARLNGEYAFTQSRSCINSSLPFGPNFSIPSGAFTSRTVLADTGSIQYNGDGTGTATFRSNGINVTTFSAFPVSVVEGTCNVTYSVAHDGP